MYREQVALRRMRCYSLEATALGVTFIFGTYSVAVTSVWSSPCWERSTAIHAPQGP